MVNSITPFPEIDLLLIRFLEAIQAILGHRLVGLYLHGSLAYGGFNPQTSDIDFAVVTRERISEEDFIALKEMHARLRRDPPTWAHKLEGAYISMKDLSRHVAGQSPTPWLGVDGHFAMERLGSDWIIQRWILREKGLAVFGPPTTSLIDPVTPDELKQAVRSSLQEWWSPPFPSPERFQSGGYRAYSILTMCRSLYVLVHGSVASKCEAAKWAAHNLAEPWCSLAEEAAQWRPGMEFHKEDDTLDMIRYTLKMWGLSDRDGNLWASD